MTVVTVQQLADAIEKNGLKQIYGQYYKSKSMNGYEVVGACALGQAAINLGYADVSTLRAAKDGKKYSNQFCPICGDIVKMEPITMVIHLNDYHRRSFQDIADTLKELWPND